MFPFNYVVPPSPVLFPSLSPDNSNSVFPSYGFVLQEHYRIKSYANFWGSFVFHSDVEVFIISYKS